MRCFEIAPSSFARRPGVSGVVDVADLDAVGGLGRRLLEARAPERKVLERQPKRLRVGEVPLEEVEPGLERCELFVLEGELAQEVPLRAQRVELLSRELVALGIEWDAEREQLRAVG